MATKTRRVAYISAGPGKGWTIGKATTDLSLAKHMLELITYFTGERKGATIILSQGPKTGKWSVSSLSTVDPRMGPMVREKFNDYLGGYDIDEV